MALLVHPACINPAHTSNKQPTNSDSKGGNRFAKGTSKNLRLNY